MADIFNPKPQIDYDTEKVQSSVPSPFSGVIGNVKAEENERFLNRQKYGIELSDDQYKILNEVIANSDNPEEESYKTACAVKWAKESEMPFSECYANIDGYISELWDKEKTSSYKNAFVAISDMFQIGRNNLQIGQLGQKILEAEIKNDKEALEVYYKELEALENDNNARADNVPRKWWTEAFKAGAESLPYTGAVAGAAMLGSFVPGGQVAGGFLMSQYLTRGQAYLDLRKKGIEPDIARQASIISGALQAGVEATLGEALEFAGAGVAAVTKKGSKAISNAVSEKIVNALQKKFVLGTGQKLAVKLATSYATNLAEEGTEEALQTTAERNIENAAVFTQNKRNTQKRNELLQQAADELGENFRESYEEELLKEYPTLEYNKAGEIAKEAAESFKGGVMGALALGIVPSSVNTAVTAVNYNAVKDAAESIPSVETFKKIVNENDGAKKVFEQFGNEQEQNDAIRQVWENAQSTRDKRDAEIIAGTKETTAFNENMEEAPAENDEGETEVIPAARDENGRLYTENELKETEEGEKQKGVFKIGNAEASDKNLYGYINYTLDDEGENKTVTINDFKMTAYRRGLTQEAYDEFAQTMAEEYPDYKIEWNPTSRAGKELKELLISKNLSGKNNGLNYYTTERLADIETRKEVSKQIAQYMPNLNGDQRAAAVALLEAGARRQGYSLTDYVQNTFGGKIFGELSELDSKNVTAAQRQEMKGAQGWRRYGNQIKAVIYAGEKADFSTFAHEIAHVWQSQLTGDLKEQAEKAFNVKNGDWDKSTFTFSDGHTESSGEAFARGFEQFLETGKAPNAEMKTLFQKFAEFLQDVYKTLKQFINMSPEIESVYNQLMDADDSVLKLAEKAVNQADRELFAKLQEEKRTKAEAEKAAAEEQKQAEEQERQDTKEEESEITLDDEAIAEPDFSPIEETEESEEEAEPETDNEAAQESGSVSDENGDIPEDMFFQKVTENLKNNGVENAEEVTKVIQDKAATITEKVRKSSEAASEALRFQIIGEKGAAAKNILFQKFTDEELSNAIDLFKNNMSNIEENAENLLFELGELNGMIQKGARPSELEQEIYNIKNEIIPKLAEILSKKGYSVKIGDDYISFFNNEKNVIYFEKDGVQVSFHGDFKELDYPKAAKDEWNGLYYSYKYRTKEAQIAAKNEQDKIEAENKEMLKEYSNLGKQIARDLIKYKKKLTKEEKEKIIENVYAYTNSDIFNPYSLRKVLEEGKVYVVIPYIRNISDKIPANFKNEVNKVFYETIKTKKYPVFMYNSTDRASNIYNSRNYDNNITNTENVNNIHLQSENNFVNKNVDNLRFQKVYHGSGADFDKFNTNEYGLTGEGSMSFGYGTYVTDSEEIARDYAARNSNIPGDYTTENIDKIKKEIKSFESIIADYKTKLEDKNISDRLRYVTEKDLKKIENKLEKKKTSLNVAEEVIKNATKKRNLYTVEIPDDGYLGWFETVSKSNRSKIAEALFNKIIELDEEGMYKGAEKELKAELNSAFESDTDGSHIYGTLIDYLGSDKEASRFLHSIGFAGIKYPAGTNYGNGNGAFNYVIFDDEQAKIIDHLRFQTEEELYNDARSFDNWQEFMEYEQGTGDWLDDVSPIPSDADAAWYKTTWELAHGIDKANEMQEEPESDSQSEQIKDAIFLVEMEKPGVLEHFLQEVDYINKFDFDEAGAPQDADEAAEFAKIQRLKDYIHTKLSHGSWISNATRVAGGKELTPATRKRLMTLITYATREYRDIYTEITGNQRFAVNPEESYFNEKVLPYAKKLNKLLTPEEALTMSPEQLRQLADSLSDEVSNKEIAAKIKNGTLKMDDELKNYITKLDRRVKLAEERYSKLEKETEADYRRIKDKTQRELLNTYDTLLRARSNLNDKKNLINQKIAKGLKLTEKYKREIQQAQATYDDIFIAWSNLTAVNKISAEVQEAMKRKEEYIATIEEQAKLKNDKAILTQISDMRKKLVKNAMRRVPFERINYEHAKKIIAIQRIFYPNLKGDVNKWIGEKPIYIKGIVAEYLTNAEKKEEIDKMLNRKANRAGETGTRNRIEYLQDLLRKTKSSDEVDKWTTRDKNLLMRYIPQSDWVKDLNLEALEKERAESIQLDIDEEGYTETKTVKNAKGKEQVLIIHRPKFSEEIGRMVKDELGADLYNILINKPFEDWTTAEMEKFTIRINDIYTEGRDELEAKRQAQRDEAKEIRDAIRNAVRDTGIEFKDTDTPEERKEKQKKLDKILGTSTVKGTLSSKKEKQRSKLGKILHGYYDANVRRVARILDGYNDGINVNELYFKEAECYDAKERMLRIRNEKIGAVLKDNNIKLEDLYQTMEIDGTVYSYDELLYILAADKDYDLKDEDAGIIKAMETDPYANNDDYAPTARNAVMFGNLGSADTDLDMKEGLADEDRETKERIANNEFTDEEKKAIEEGFELITTPGTKKYIAVCHQRYARVIQAAKAMLEENPQFEKLMDAIDADYTEQFERLQKICIEEFNAPVNRVKKYVPLNRMESNGDTNENRVREDLLATSGAGTGRQYVDKGMIQKRINISPLNQKPVELGLYKTWADATERTEHFINYAGYVRELNRVYKSRESTYLRRFIENRYGKDAVEYIDNYIAEVANPNANSATSPLDTIVRTLRGKTAPAYLSWKASSIIKQAATSPMPYMQFVTPVEYLKASFDIIGSKGRMYDDIKEKSIFMNNRVMDPLIDLIKEQTESATNPVTSKLNKFSAIGMQGLEWIDWACVAPGWLACYRKKYAELEKANDIELIEAQIREENEMLDPSNPERMTNDQIKAAAEERAKSKDEIENEAVQWADDCTRLCQPSNRKVDLAPLFKESGKGSEIGKAFLQFQTSLNVIWQNLRYDIPYAIRQKQFKQVAGMILGYTIAGILVNAITEGIKPKDDDEDKELSVLRKFLYYSTTQFTDAIPVLGSAISAIDNMLLTGDKGLTSSSNDLIPMFTKAATGTQSAIKGNWEKALKNYLEAAGLATGLPVSGTKEALRFFGIGDGEEGAEFKPGSLLGRRE